MHVPACYLLFTEQAANLRYSAVPDRYLCFPDFVLDQAAWDDLQIPVGLAFIFRNSVQDRLGGVLSQPGRRDGVRAAAGGVGPDGAPTRSSACCSPTSRRC